MPAEIKVAPPGITISQGRTFMVTSGQDIPPETQTAWIDDWAEMAAFVGLERFVEGVKRARMQGHYFPLIADIRPMIPDKPLPDGERWKKELRELTARKNCGEKFYTIQDVFKEVARRIKAREIKPTNPSWYEWAAKFK